MHGRAFLAYVERVHLRRAVRRSRVPCVAMCIFGYIEDGQRKRRAAMPRTTTMTVRVSGALSEFVAANVGETGFYESVSEYIRDLIRRDKERTEQEAFDRLKAELAT